MKVYGRKRGLRAISPITLETGLWAKLPSRVGFAHNMVTLDSCRNEDLWAKMWVAGYFAHNFEDGFMGENAI